MKRDELNLKSQDEYQREVLQSMNPVTQQPLPEQFHATTKLEINEAVIAADEAWKLYKNTSDSEKAIFLRAIAEGIEDLGDALIRKVRQETGLPEGRIIGERGRTCNQLRSFASMLDEGSWVDAIIDEALPDRQPNPRVDLRKMQMAVGPVAVFTASNFPLAFSTAGGDTASALAAGCSVIVKAHPSHLGTNEMIAAVIDKAAQKCRLPKGIFSTVRGGIATGQQLVMHPMLKAVGFTGSNQGGRALFDIANRRHEPIPVFAEMGSVNPIFILEKKLVQDHQKLATMITMSVNLGGGQFCTKPGLVILQKGEASEKFFEELTSEFEEVSSGTMLNENIFKAYNQKKTLCLKSDSVTTIYDSEKASEDWQGAPAIACVSASAYLEHSNLHEEVFGPFTLIVCCDNKQELLNIATHLEGQLTATIMSTAEELDAAKQLVGILSEKVGRVIYNGIPTGVEVCQAMHHGGPFPSTTNPMFTSVGVDSIKRFVRPVSFQNFPKTLLPAALKPENPLQIWRTVNGEKTNI